MAFNHMGGHKVSKHDENERSGHSIHERQCPGGNTDDTPGQVGRHNVDASVHMASTERGAKGLDSMGGHEHRGRDNAKREGY